MNPMNVQIAGTTKLETLSITDRNGINYAADMIGNYGFEGFHYDAENNVYACDQDTFEWWERVLAAHQQVNDRIAELSSVYGSDKVQEIVSAVGDYDLEDLPGAINSALDEAFAAGN